MAQQELESGHQTVILFPASVTFWASHQRMNLSPTVPQILICN